MTKQANIYLTAFKPLINRLSARHTESEASESDLGRCCVGAAITANLMVLVGGLSAPLSGSGDI